jgi:predicted Rossmann fold nucleotide-binding protein DprA/Smf involved in DNA uptake
MRTALKNHELVNLTVQVIEETAPEPASVDYVSKRLPLSWGTTRALLMQLALEGKLQAIKTTSGWIFRSKKRCRERSEK